MVLFVRDSATQASVSLVITNQTSGEQLLAKALAEFGLPSSLPASLTFQGKPLQLGQGSLSKAGVAPLVTVTLDVARMPGGMDSNLLSDNDYVNMSTSAVRVRAPKDSDDEFKPLKRQKTKFVHNEEEEKARKEKEDFDNNAGFFTKLFSEDKGILYDWAKALEPDDAEKLGDPDANKQALSQARQ